MGKIVPSTVYNTKYKVISSYIIYTNDILKVEAPGCIAFISVNKGGIFKLKPPLGKKLHEDMKKKKQSVT